MHSIYGALILTSVYLRILETVHVACCIQFIYFYLITGFGDYEKLVSVDWCVISSTFVAPTNAHIYSRGIGVS